MDTSAASSRCSTGADVRAERFELFEGFRPLSLRDRPLLEPILRERPQPLAGFTFAGLFTWGEVYAYEWTMLPSAALCFSCTLQEGGPRNLVQPVGQLTLDEQRRLVASARGLDHDLVMVGVNEAFLVTHPVIVAAASLQEDRGRFDYIYNAADLAFLKGRNYVRKRNHVAQAEHAHRWTHAPLSPATLPVVRQIAEKALQDLDDSNPTLKQENRALGRVLDHVFELEQDGLVLFADGAPAAFSIFEAQAPQVAVVHFERAIRAYKGAFQIVNREAARVLHARGFERINREDDIGVEGLRKAKLSYYPVELAKSYTLTFKR